MIKTYTDADGRGVDICCGSGTTAVAAMNTDRIYIVNDNNLEYVKTAEKRARGVCNTPAANFIILKGCYQDKYNKAGIKKEEREMIYTSYFAKIKELENNNVIPVATCGKVPGWYKGLQYKKLAPQYGFFMEWKKIHDNDYYTEYFQSEVLGVGWCKCPL